MQKLNDPDTFYYSFNSLVSSKADAFFTTLNQLTVSVMVMDLEKQMQQEFLKEKERGTTPTQKALPKTKNELKRNF